MVLTKFAWGLNYEKFYNHINKFFYELSSSSLCCSIGGVIMTMDAIPAPVPVHGGAADRGSADAYYGRPYDPHMWPEGTYKGIRVEKDEKTVDEIEEYRYAYENEDDRKDWG